MRDYIHVVDLAKGHVKAIEQLVNHKGIYKYNLGTGKGTSVLELVHTFEKVNQIKVPYKIVGRRAGDIAECYAGVEKAKKELGWIAERNVEDMCRDAWRWGETMGLSSKVCKLILKNKDVIRVFIFSFLIYFIAYSIFLYPHYSSDSYANVGDIDTGIHLQNGRIVSFCIQTIMNFLGIKTVEVQSLFTMIYLLALAGCTTAVYMEIMNKRSQYSNLTKIIFGIALHMVFINVFFAEWFLYVESFPATVVGITLTISAVILTSRGGIGNMLTSFFLLSLAVNSYQLYIVFFLILALSVAFIKYDGKLSKKTFKHSIEIICEGAGAISINLGIMKVLKMMGLATANSRDIVLNIPHLLNNLCSLAVNQKDIWANAVGLLPFNIMGIYMMILLGTILYLMARRKNILEFIYSVLLVCCGLGITFLSHIATKTMWLAPRTLVGVFLTVSLLLLIIGVYTQDKAKIQKIIVTSSIVFLTLNIVNIHGIAINNIITNKLDAFTAQEINNAIHQYEIETGNRINNIGVAHDENPTWAYDGIQYVNHDMNIKGLVVSWADVNLINYICGENYEKIDVPEDIYNIYVENQDWMSWDIEEQLIFVNNTAYLIIY